MERFKSCSRVPETDKRSEDNDPRATNAVGGGSLPKTSKKLQAQNDGACSYKLCHSERKHPVILNNPQQERNQ